MNNVKYIAAVCILFFTAYVNVGDEISAYANEGSIEKNDREATGNTNVDKGKVIVIIGASYAEGWRPEAIAGIKAINKGAGGEETHQMLERFDRDVISLKPDAVIIWGFINDIFRAKRANVNERLVETLASTKKMIELSKSSGTITILATEVTIRPPSGWGEKISGIIGAILQKKSYQDYVNSHVLQTNKKMAQLAKDEDIFLLDIFKTVSEKSGERKNIYAKDDGSHISKKGYKAINEYAQKAVRAYFNQQ